MKYKYKYIKKLLKLLKKLGLENKPVFCNMNIVESSNLEGLTMINGNITDNSCFLSNCTIFLTPETHKCAKFIIEHKENNTNEIIKTLAEQYGKEEINHE